MIHLHPEYATPQDYPDLHRAILMGVADKPGSVGSPSPIARVWRPLEAEHLLGGCGELALLDELLALLLHGLNFSERKPGGCHGW